jgi:AraC-like DNA-binding protein
VEGLPDATLADPPPRYTLAFVRPLALALGRLGVDPDAFLSDLGVPDGARDGFVSVIHTLEALEAIAARMGVPHLGLELLKNVPLGAFGLYDYRFSTSSTLAEALESYRPKQRDFTESTRYELAIDGDAAKIEICPLYRFARLYLVGQSFGLGFAARRLRDVLGEAAVKLTAARFVPEAPRLTRPYDDYFGVPVEFGAPSYEIVFPRELLDARLLTASPELARVLADHAPAAPERAGRADPFVDRVRTAIAEALAEPTPDLTIVDVSARLAMSPRSLQRRLREQRSSFSALVDQVRRDLAQELLAHEGTLLCEIAYRLGFSGVTPFFRAFRRWTGASPREFQRKIRAG